jgi:cytochrome c-type biogenesis protein CcmH
MREHALGRLRVLALATCLGLGLILGIAPPDTFANSPATAGENPEIEARMMALAAELRCLVCQNQTVADSHAELARDLRQQLRELLAQGMNEAQIRTYMTDRYGDFLLYRPPFKASTAPLWIGPVLLMLVAVGSLLAVLRRRLRMTAGAFDPDSPDEDHDHGAHR